ncbi:unnamed protein product [Rotaria sp. Silwood2]|nr:unnamed protein product [Rotaria sp. Silwood2]CAF3212197.1 unnamed protein product [Rotaria sp. Silwood2]CAF4575382.1 unnamed protein product [Rotaria sp. Silwood2]CAF4671607.1 unnamed protein product [Rotaria sp. Silwood2]
MRESRTIDERVVIVRVFSKYENVRDVQRRWEDHFDATPPHLTTISLVNKKFDENGTVEDLPRSGRSTALSEEKLEKIEDMVTTNP